MSYEIITSKNLFEKAQKHIPGGVNSPVRAFNSVGGNPVFIKSAKGAYLYDEDGNSYIDYINSWGPMILGHARKEIVDAVKEQAENSFSYGAPSRLELEMAELIKSMCPNVDLVRMVNSGTEACMSAIRVARGHTGRNKIMKFEGNYHGHADSFLVKAGSGVATFGIQNVPGVTQSTAADTLNATYNDLASVEALVAGNKNQLAAIILEPLAGNMGCIPPEPGFLQGLRDICNKEGIVLIFDEVMTGFRLAPGGAQELFGINADLVCYGKIIGGGLPVGAYGGKFELMSQVAPSGKIYQAGTLSGNPIAMRAGLTTLSILNEQKRIYTELENTTNELASSLQNIFKEKLPIQVNHRGSMISVHFSENRIKDFASASAANNQLFNKYFHYCLANGVYLPPSAFETWFISTEIQRKELDKTLEVTASFLKTI